MVRTWKESKAARDSLTNNVRMGLVRTQGGGRQDNEGTEVSISQKMERKRAASHTHGSDQAAVLRYLEKAR